MAGNRHVGEMARPVSPLRRLSLLTERDLRREEQGYYDAMEVELNASSEIDCLQCLRGLEAAQARRIIFLKEKRDEALRYQDEFYETFAEREMEVPAHLQCAFLHWLDTPAAQMTHEKAGVVQELRWPHTPLSCEESDDSDTVTEPSSPRSRDASPNPDEGEARRRSPTTLSPSTGAIPKKPAVRWSAPLVLQSSGPAATTAWQPSSLADFWNLGKARLDDADAQPATPEEPTALLPIGEGRRSDPDEEMVDNSFCHYVVWLENEYKEALLEPILIGRSLAQAPRERRIHCLTGNTVPVMVAEDPVVLGVFPEQSREAERNRNRRLDLTDRERMVAWDSDLEQVHLFEQRREVSAYFFMIA